MAILHHIFRMLSYLTVPVLFLGFGGWLHPAGDSFAVLRPFTAVVVLGLAVFALLLRRWWVAAIMGVTGGGALLSVLVYFWAGSTADAPATLSHYQKNMLFLNQEHRALADDILTLAPDFVSLQEVSRRNEPLLAMLKDAYPTQILCPFSRVGGTAVLSRWPRTEAAEICLSGNGLAALEIASPEGPLWVVSVHFHWPWPMQQAEQAEVVLPALAALDGPVLVGGDFNMVPWSDLLRRVRGASGTAFAAPSFHSFSIEDMIPLAIDHVLVPAGALSQNEIRPRLGSDHAGILTRFSLP